MYSSIEIEERRTVIERCYFPLLDLASSGVPIGIEATALTLEMIHDLYPEWIARFAELVASRRIEFIGSGYAQLIGPIVPEKVNNWNQKIGLKTYEELLQTRPDIALVNEMACSSGIITHYLDAGYRAIITEWNNPRRVHPEWKNEWRFYPQRARGNDGRELPVIWADSLGFQKFQRFVYEEISSGEFLDYLSGQSGSAEGYFPLYSNDAEIFDFRPGRYQTEAGLDQEKNDWKRIGSLFRRMDEKGKDKLVFPSEVLNGLTLPHGGHTISLESAEQPIPVKKQEKYNINRWALTGRDDLGINTSCYRHYRHLVDVQNESEMDWKELCWLWSSDFRTHITGKRWRAYLERLQRLEKKVIPVASPTKGDIGWKEIPGMPFNRGKTRCTGRGRYIEIGNRNSSLRLNANKGYILDEFHVPSVSSRSLLGTLEHGYFDDISFGADFFSGHAVIERTGFHKITDLACDGSFIYFRDDDLKVLCRTSHPGVEITKTVRLMSGIVSIEKMIRLEKRQHEIIRPFHFTIDPAAFDEGSLYFAAHNGGKDPDHFPLGKESFRHHGMLSPLISSRHGLGATEGIVCIGDAEKEIQFTHDPACSALIPSIDFQWIRKGQFFLRLVYSAQELDETFRPNDEQYVIHSVITVSAHRRKS